jgi:hypothetical protein
MMKNTCWLSMGALIAAGAVYAADFDADMRAAAALCGAQKHEEAIQAYVTLGEACSDPDKRYEAISAAALCARLHGGSEAKALKLAEHIKVEPYAKACRALVYQWQTSPSNVLAEFRTEDFSAWPETLAAIGYDVRGSAYYNLGNGTNAAADFLKAFQFGKSMDKWTALRRLGNTYWKLLDDEIIAEACLRKCAAECGGGHPGLQARIDLATLLLSQQRVDAALQCLREAKPGGSWQAALLLMEAKVYAAMGKKPEAAAALDAASKTVGIQPHQKKECEALLVTLK